MLKTVTGCQPGCVVFDVDMVSDSVLLCLVLSYGVIIIVLHNISLMMSHMSHGVFFCVVVSLFVLWCLFLCYGVSFVSNNVIWCLTVSHCVSWCLNGVSLCLMVSCIVSWCLMEPYVISWYLKLSHGVWSLWYLKLSHGILSCLMVCLVSHVVLLCLTVSQVSSNLYS